MRWRSRLNTSEASICSINLQTPIIYPSVVFFSIRIVPINSQKQLAHWAVDVTVEFYACMLSSSLMCNLWTVEPFSVVRPADPTDLVQVISCSSSSCLINTEPLELLRLQPSEPIASESEKV